MQETGWWREQRRQQEPSDHTAGLVPVWKESRIGRVSDSRAVPSSVQPDQWGVLEPKSPLEESHILSDGAAFVTHCAL